MTLHPFADNGNAKPFGFGMIAMSSCYHPWRWVDASALQRWLPEFSCGLHSDRSQSVGVRFQAFDLSGGVNFLQRCAEVPAHLFNLSLSYGELNAGNCMCGALEMQLSV